MSKDLFAENPQALQKIEPQGIAIQPVQPVTSLMILEAAVRGGINKENVEVVERLAALRREEMREEAKTAFAKAFFQLRRSMPELYADKEAKDKGGSVVYTYCSEGEMSRMLEPHLFRHGFTTLFGQRQEDNRTVAIVTLIHEGGHQETREFSVRSGATNAMKDATAADTGSTTTAWRHLMIKMFGLKSRISTDQDARIDGEAVTLEQADELEQRVAILGDRINRDAFFQFAGAKKFADIAASRYDELDALLRRKENPKQKS